MDSIFYAVIILAVILITRELWTWFLKQNTIVKQNDEIIRLLKKLANEPDEPDLKNSYKELINKTKKAKPQ